MMFLWLPVLFIVPFVLLWAARSGSGAGCCGSMYTDSAQSSGAGADPMEIASRRLARSEITPAEFDEIRRAIS